MPSTVLGRPLHCGKCIEDLNRKSEEIQLDKRNPKNVCQSLSKLLDQGKKHKLDGDDEMAYIVLMRWVYCIRWLQKTPEYLRNKDLLKPYVKGSQVKDILNQLEDIADKLKKRYNAKALEDSAKRIVDNVENMQIKPESANDDDLMNEVSDVQLNLPDTPTDDPAKKEANKLISCMDMYREMHKLDDRMIIIDIRAREDFQNSQIKSNQCINIPTDHIRLGILATDLFKSLASLGVDENRRRVIRHRSQEHCDLIVLLDWQTTAASLKPTNRLNTLKIILQDWDPGVAYREIVVLDGGYKEWLTRFPTLTTNPSIMLPDDEGDNIAEMLEEVEYPDWNHSDEDQPFIKVKHKPVPERSLKPTIKNVLIIPNADSLDYTNLDSIKALNSLNETNIYPRTDIPNDAFNNGNKFGVLSAKDADVSNMNDQDSKRRVLITQPVENELAKPAIDRSSKPIGEKTYDTNSEILLSLLKQKNETLKSKVKLENRRLELESQLFGREVAEDSNSEQKAETLKQIGVLNTTIMEKMKHFLGIEQKLREYKQDKSGVNPAQHEAQVRLELDIGLAENEAKNVAIRRKVFLNERDKKLEENLEMKRKNMSTPPRKTEQDTHTTPLRQDGPSVNSTLKRSYSSPNLAQMESRKESIGRGLDNKIPQVDRTSKPSQQQQPRNNISNDTVINRQPLRRDREQRMSPVFGNMVNMNFDYDYKFADEMS